MSPEEADQAFKELDKNGDGHISPEEFYEGCAARERAAGGRGARGDDGGLQAPRQAGVQEQQGGMGRHGREGSEFMTPEQFKKWAADLGIPPGQAEKLFKEMDKDGDGLLSEHEFQNAMGIDEDELRERALEKFGNAEEILKQADLDGDGQLTEEELKEFMEEKLGISPEQAEKLAKDLMKKYDKDGDGKLSKEEAKPIFQATASDLQDRIQ